MTRCNIPPSWVRFQVAELISHLILCCFLVSYKKNVFSTALVLILWLFFSGVFFCGLLWFVCELLYADMGFTKIYIQIEIPDNCYTDALTLFFIDVCNLKSESFGPIFLLVFLSSSVSYSLFAYKLKACASGYLVFDSVFFFVCFFYLKMKLEIQVHDGCAS